MRRLLCLALCLLVASASAQTAPPDTLASDSLRASDSTSVADTLFFADEDVPPLVVLSDSAAEALDSAAVADLQDSTAVVLPEEAFVGVPVYLYGRPIFEIYSGLGALTAEQRAARLTERLDALSRNEAFDPDSVTVTSGATLTTLQFGARIVMTVTDADAEALGMPRNQAALEYRRLVVREVSRVRERSTLGGVLRNAGLAALLVALMLAVLWGLGRVFRRVDGRFGSLREQFLPNLTIRGIEVLRGEQIARAGRGLIGLMRLSVSLLVVYLFVTTILGLFPWTQAWSRLLLGYLLSPVRALALGLVGALPDLFAIVVIILLVRWAIKGSNWLFAQVASGALSFPGFYPEFARPTSKIVRFLLIMLGVFVIYPYTPIASSGAFQGLSIFLGLLFSLGSTSAIANIVAGTLLTYTRAFQIGDRIKVNDTVGDVVERTFLVTRLRTPKNEIVSVPNAATLQAQLVNYSQMAREGPGVIVHTTVTIGYDVPWVRVHAMLEDAARRSEGVEADPPPFVLQTALGDFSVAYQLNAYTRQARRLPAVLSHLHQHLQDVFAEAGIEILSPTYEAQRDGNALTLPTAAPARGPAAEEGNGAA